MKKIIYIIIVIITCIIFASCKAHKDQEVPANTEAEHTEVIATTPKATPTQSPTPSPTAEIEDMFFE